MLKAFGYIERNVQSDFFSEKDLFYIIRAQHVLSYDLISDMINIGPDLLKLSTYFSYVGYLHYITYIVNKNNTCRMPSMEEILERLERIQALILRQPDRFTIKNSDQIFELLGKSTSVRSIYYANFLSIRALPSSLERIKDYQASMCRLLVYNVALYWVGVHQSGVYNMYHSK